MRAVLAVLLVSILLFGCAGNSPGASAPSATQSPGGGTTQACSPSYSFSDISKGVLSESTALVATVSCEGGSNLVVLLDGNMVASQMVASNDTTPINFGIVAPRDGMLNLTVEIDNETVLARDWQVNPLGSSDISGLDVDTISFKEWHAMGFTIGNTTTIGRISAYMARQSSQTHPDSTIIVEIRYDDNGNPGALIANVSEPITVATLTPNWLNFDLAPSALRPGKYWAVFKVNQPSAASLVSDTVTLHEVTVDKTNPGNDYTRQMLLNVDEKTGAATESAWQPLSYDRTYSVLVMAPK